MKRTLSLLLALVMVVTMIPAVFAETDNPNIDFDDMLDCEHTTLTYTDNGDGSTHKVTCSKCGEVTVENEEHTYTDGTCVCGAVEDGCATGNHTYTNDADAICNECGERREDYTPLTNESIKYVGNYLSFQEYIGMQPLIKASLVSGYEKAYVLAVQTPVGGEPTTQTLELMTYSSTYKMVDMKVMAWDMTDNIQLTIVVENADGVVTHGAVISTSVEELALEKLPSIKAQGTAKSEQQCRILVDMLNYGAAVQVAYNHNASSLPNTNLGEYAAYATSKTPTIGGAVTSTGAAASTVKDYGIYISMQAQVELTMMMKLNDSTDSISNYELRVTPEGGETVVYSADTFKLNNSYHVPNFALKAQDFRTNHTMAVYDIRTGEPATKVYVASVEAKGSAALSDATLGPVVENMMKYGDAVAAYLAM